MRRGPILSLLGIGTLAGVIAAAVAIFLPWLPSEASNERGRIDALFWFTVAICILIFAIVVAVMLSSILHFRTSPDDESDGPPIHGHTRLEIDWTHNPTVVVTATRVFRAIVLTPESVTGQTLVPRQLHAPRFARTF